MNYWSFIPFEKLYLIPSRNGLMRSSSVRGVGCSFINMGELFSNDRIFDIQTELVQLNAKEQEDATLKDGDLLFARQSLVFEGAGKCSLVVKLSKITSFESHLIRVRLNPSVAESAFYYYYFNSPAKPIRQIVLQCAQAGIRGSDLNKLKVPYPELEEQKHIADILSAYDDAIENNNRRIKILEQMAENLYKEWFVRMCFPGHETAEYENGLPKGWTRDRLEQFIEVDPTVRIPKNAKIKSVPMAALSTTLMYLDENEITEEPIAAGSRFCNGDVLLAKITPCLENGKTGFVNFLKDDEYGCGSTEFIVLRSKTLSPYFVYFLARSPYFRGIAIGSMNGADGRQRASVSKLKKMKIVCPAQSILTQFTTQTSPIFTLIFELGNLNRKLRHHRDLLLPRLMSGKMEAMS